MTDLTSLDLVDRLEERAHYEDNGGVVEKMLFDVGSLLREAATEILRLRALTTPREGCETRLSLLARWYQRLLACQQENSIVFYPHDSEDGWLATAILDAMVTIDRQRIDLTRETARANAAISERDASEERRLRMAEDCGAREDELEAERDALTARVAELETGLLDLLSWFGEKPSPAEVPSPFVDEKGKTICRYEWRLEAGKYGADDAINHARSLLTKPTAGDQT